MVGIVAVGARHPIDTARQVALVSWQLVTVAPCEVIVMLPPASDGTLPRFAEAETSAACWP